MSFIFSTYQWGGEAGTETIDWSHTSRPHSVAGFSPELSSAGPFGGMPFDGPFFGHTVAFVEGKSVLRALTAENGVMEGPGVHEIASELSYFQNQRIESVGGNAEQPLELLEGRMIDDVRAVKKRLFFDAAPIHLVIHFLMYGSYRVNDKRDLDERLELICTDDTLRIYSCSVKVLEQGDPQLSEYDQPSEDVLSVKFDRERAVATLADREDPIIDVLLDQSVFGGVGNMIKNEVLWELAIPPEMIAAELSAERRQTLVDETVQWATNWYMSKQSNDSVGLNVYQKDECPRCGTDVIREELGGESRITYWCPSCQSP